MRVRPWIKKTLWIALGAAAVLTLLVVVTLQRPAFGGTPSGARLERIRKSPEFINGRLQNTPPQNTDNSLTKLYRQYSGGQIRYPLFTIPVLPVQPSLFQTPARPGMRAIWFGHSSTLLEIDGVRVMMDPVFADIVSPIPIGPKRFHPTPIALENMPRVDAVMISHDHYDHLDMNAVKHMAARGTHFYVGLGVGAHLERWGVPAAQIHEMDWWESAEINGVRIDCTPARHYSGRRRMGNATLWASWMVRGPKHSAYYSGDTGYGEHFKEIRRRLGAPELTLMKVGAYGTTWLDIHMDPESSVRAHGDLGGKVMLPVHWATFNLSYHDWDEPILRTMAAANAQNAQVITPRLGEVYEFGAPFTSVAWYDQQRSAKR